ncbi:hypothetical protein RhiJN_27464 [Ceratobasidium sp. AG-Ba]|nr:hypothetical protein RhiJN_27464 [Ceratobasidium sp. AG-Ba]
MVETVEFTTDKLVFPPPVPTPTRIQLRITIYHDFSTWRVHHNLYGQATRLSGGSMTLSSLFRSLDDLDDISDEDDHISLPDDSNAVDDPYQHDQLSLKRTADSPGYPESKRARTLQVEGTLPTRQPRLDGTGAPPSETTASTPVPSPSVNGLGPPVVQLASSCPADERTRAVHPHSTLRLMSPDLCSRRQPALGRANDNTGAKPPKASTRVHQTTNKTVPQNSIKATASSEPLGDHVAHRDRASVPDTTSVVTRSNFQASMVGTKPVSQSRVRPPATTARANSKDPSTAITSNSFRRGSVAPGGRDNHVAGSSSANLSTGQPSFGEQITLVSRKSRHPSKSGKSGSVKDIRDQCTTISEFASYLQTLSRDAESKGPRHKPVFRDLTVYYAANDPGKKISHSTKRRMEILSERGAMVVGTFDLSITHIISDLAEKPLLAVLGLRSVKSIPPSIWVVDWTWVTKSMNTARRLEETPYERFHKRLVIDSRPSRVDNDKYRSASVGTSETGASSEISSREVSEAGGDECPKPARSGLSIGPGSATHAETIPDPLEDVVALARSMASLNRRFLL